MLAARSILIAIPNWVGDVVMATAALSAIRRACPEAEIVHLMRPYVAEVLAGCSLADDAVFWPGPGSPTRGTLQLVRDLRRRRFDLAILMTNSFRSAAVVRAAGVRRRVGYARDARGWLLTDRISPKRDGRHHVPVPALDYYNDLARFVGCGNVTDRMVLSTSPADEAAIDQRLGTTESGRPIVALNPGANYGSAKCWPAEKYAALARMLTDRCGARVVASLSPKERDIADRLRAAATCPMDIFVDPPLGLGPLKALIRRCDLLITNDTGPRHFAAAFDVPVVTVFGSSDPAWTDTRFSRERIVKLDLDCQPCMERVCPLKHHRCMVDLSPDLVMKQAEELLSTVSVVNRTREPLTTDR